MTSNNETECIFCNKGEFPKPFQVVSEAPEYWLFVLDIKPQTDFHSLIVLKAEAVEKIGHIEDFGDDRLPKKAIEEFGTLLNKACVSIKACDPNIEKVLIVSLNTGKGSQHLHFHLIPKHIGEQIKTINNPKEDGGGMLFLARKEIVVDTFSDFIRSTTGSVSEKLLKNIKKATEKKISENVSKLKNNFKW